MRRLPVYLVVDTSGSMTGEPIESVKNGIQEMLVKLRQDPHALETVHLSVITFDDTAKQVTPLTELPTFQMPAISASGGTELGQALALTAKCISTEVVRSTPNQKGDWKPMIILCTDSQPTDDWRAGYREFSSAKVGLVIGGAVCSADLAVLKEITPTVVKLDVDPQSITSFFRWVTDSIAAGSTRIEKGQGEVQGFKDLPPPPPELNVVV